MVKKEDEDDDVDSSRDVSFEQGGAERDTTSNNGPTEETIPIAKSTTATSTVDMSIMNSSKAPAKKAVPKKKPAAKKAAPKKK